MHPPRTIHPRHALTAFLLAAPLLLFGCDLFGGEDTATFTFGAVEGVVVANGGNFGDQNGFLTVYDPATGQAAHLEDLGGFSQSLALRAGRAYVAVNTFSTGRIDLLDLASGRRTGQIQNLPAPRYLAFVDDAKAYATNFVFGANGLVSVIDLAANKVAGEALEVGASPEGIVVVDARAFVANYGTLGDGTTLSVIDTRTDRVVGAVELGCDGPKDLVVDGQDEVMVVCQGKTVFNDDFTEVLEQTNGQVVFVNPRAETVVGRIAFERQLGSSNFTQAAYAVPQIDEAYVLSGDAGLVYRIDTGAHTLAAEIAAPQDPRLTGLTAVAYDAVARRLYLARFARSGAGGPDVAAAGAVVVLDRRGAQVDRFIVGPSPSHIELLRR